jgi:uncharacterized protein
MDNPLDDTAVRVLGSLIEKEITTPDNYPLTLNSLVAACNQTTNREPVMALDEAAVTASLNDLKTRGLVREVYRSDSRAKRYRQVMSETMSLHAPEVAVMCVLMLRGPQTSGEIKTRAARMFDFIDLSHVEVTLNALMTMTSPLVFQLPRRPGQKEVRYAHLLSGEPDIESLPPVSAAAGPERAQPRADRVQELELAVESLRAEVAELRSRFEEFSRQFQ